MRVFFKIIAWAMNRPIQIALGSYLLSIFTVGFCAPVQIYGPNVLRLFIAEKILWWLGPVSSAHVAGALTDFKKLMLFATSASLLWMIRAVYSFDLYGEQRRLSTSDVRAYMTLRKDWWTVLAFVFVIATFTLFIYNNILPAGAQHVFGFKGIGLLSSFSRHFSAIEHVAIVLYRLSYLPVYILLFVASSLALPAYLRSIIVTARASHIPPPRTDEIGFATVAFQVLIIPALGIFFIFALYIATDTYGVGELHGVPQNVALTTGLILVVWTILGFMWILRRRVVEKDPIRKLILGLREIRQAFKHLTFYLLIGTFIIIFGIIKSLNVSTIEILRADVKNRLIEYCNWDINMAENVLTLVSDRCKDFKLVKRNEASVSDIWGKLGIKAESDWTNIRSLQSYLIQVALIRSLFHCTLENNPAFRLVLSEHYKSLLESDDSLRTEGYWLFELGARDIVEAIVPLSEDACKVKKTTWWYNKSALMKYRPHVLRLLVQDLTDETYKNRRIFLFQSFGNPGDSTLQKLRKHIDKTMELVCYLYLTGDSGKNRDI